MCYHQIMEVPKAVYNKPNDQGSERPEKMKIPTLAQYKKSLNKELKNDPLLIKDRQGRGHPEHFLNGNTYIHFLSDLETAISALKSVGCVEESRTTESTTESDGSVTNEIILALTYQQLQFYIRFFDKIQKGRFTNIDDEIGYYEIGSRMGSTLPSEGTSYSGMFMISDGPEFTAPSMDTYTATYQKSANRKKLPLKRPVTTEEIGGKRRELAQGEQVSTGELFDFFTQSDNSWFYLKRLHESSEMTKYILSLMESLKKARIPFFGYCKDGGPVKIREE